VKIEYLHDGSSDCPLIRIYGNEPTLVKNLVDIFDRLSEGDRETVALHNLNGFEVIDNLKLFVSLGNKNLGIKPLKERNSFHCILVNETWAQVADLARPFCKRIEDDRICFQWLDETSEISLLITTSDLGQW